jgi:SnoaL-like domain
MTVSADRTAEIIALLASYSVYMDSKNAPAWLELFSKNGQVEMVGTPYTATGHDELAGFVGAGQGGVHLTGLPLITEADGVLSSITSFSYNNTGQGKVMTGYYNDEYVEEDGALRFAKREVRVVRD